MEWSKKFFIENVTVLNQSTIKVIDEIFHDKSNLCVNRICGSESDDYDHFCVKKSGGNMIKFLNCSKWSTLYL